MILEGFRCQNLCLGEIYLVVSTIPIVIIRMFLACASCLFFLACVARASLATAARR